MRAAPDPNICGPILVAGAHVQGLFMHVEGAVREGETVLGWGYDEPLDGGKATNQAVAAARLGGAVSLLTAVGDDARGHRALRSLHAEGVDVRWVQVFENRSTDVGFVMLPPSGIPLIVSAQDLSRCLDQAQVRAAKEAILHAAFLVCQLEAPVNGVMEALLLARAAGTFTILNPSPMRIMPPALMELVDIVVLNEHEANAMLGAEHPPPEQAARVVKRWPHCAAILTAGPLGAFVARSRTEVTHIPAPPVAAVDTTGAGDAFLGALAAALSEGEGLVQAVSFGVLAASLSVQREGSWPSYVTRPEIDEARRQMTHANKGEL